MEPRFQQNIEYYLIKLNGKKNYFGNLHIVNVIIIKIRQNQ